MISAMRAASSSVSATSSTPSFETRTAENRSPVPARRRRTSSAPSSAAPSGHSPSAASRTMRAVITEAAKTASYPSSASASATEMFETTAVVDRMMLYCRSSGPSPAQGFSTP